MSWQVVLLDERVERELRSLAEDLQARFSKIVEMLEAAGPFEVREPYVKPLGNKLWEMRMKGRDGIARAAYIASSGRRLVVLHVFEKKTQKTPAAAIQMALRRAKEAGFI